MTGHGAGQMGRDLAYGDTSEPVFPATPCRPMSRGTTSLDQQQYSTHHPRSMVS
jgi:hypothetical protein